MFFYRNYEKDILVDNIMISRPKIMYSYNIFSQKVLEDELVLSQEDWVILESWLSCKIFENNM